MVAAWFLILFVQDESKPLKIDAPLLESLKIGGELRVRGEWRDPADYRIPGTFGRPATDDPDDDTDFVLQRTRLNLDGTVIRQLRVFVQIQDSRQWGDEPSLNADTADVEMKQGFLEIREDELSIKLGRVEVPALGDQRMISPLPWHNVGRSMDGGVATYAPEGWRLSVLAANIQEAALTRDDADDDFILGGVYASCRKVEGHELDVYLYWRDLSNRVFLDEDGGSPGEREDLTTGIRLKGVQGAFDYTAEVAHQFGHQVRDRIRAWAAAVTFGATLDHDWKPRIGFELARSSGDEDPTDGKSQTFDPLLPFTHNFHGHADLVGWRNLESLMVTMKANPCEAVSVHVDVHAFRLAEERDAWYGAAGTAVRRDATGAASRTLGQEVDVYARWRLWGRVDFWGGYSRFVGGPFVEDTGFEEDTDWVFLQMELKF